MVAPDPEQGRFNIAEITRCSSKILLTLELPGPLFLVLSSSFCSCSLFLRFAQFLVFEGMVALVFEGINAWGCSRSIHLARVQALEKEERLLSAELNLLTRFKEDDCVELDDGVHYAVYALSVAANPTFPVCLYRLCSTGALLHRGLPQNAQTCWMLLSISNIRPSFGVFWQAFALLGVSGLGI